LLCYSCQKLSADLGRGEDDRRSLKRDKARIEALLEEERHRREELEKRIAHIKASYFKENLELSMGYEKDLAAMKARYEEISKFTSRSVGLERVEEGEELPSPSQRGVKSWMKQLGSSRKNGEGKLSAQELLDHLLRDEGLVVSIASGEQTFLDGKREKSINEI
jgi:hypothetical protein